MQSFFVCRRWSPASLDTKIPGLVFLILAEMDTVFQLAPLLTFPMVPSTLSLTLKTRTPAGSDLFLDKRTESWVSEFSVLTFCVDSQVTRHPENLGLSAVMISPLSTG